jgi:hypothetical protein
VATLAAEEIRRKELPPASVDNPLVLRIVEESAAAQENDMERRRANLLAAAATNEKGRHHAAYMRILSELEPVEAALLDFAFVSTRPPEALSTRMFSNAQLMDPVGGGTANIENLIRLGVLLRYEQVTDPYIGAAFGLTWWRSWPSPSRDKVSCGRAEGRFRADGTVGFRAVTDIGLELAHNTSRGVLWSVFTALRRSEVRSDSLRLCP